MKNNSKYYILRRNDEDTIEYFLGDLQSQERQEIEKRLNKKLPLVLIEKNYTEEEETVTNVWTINYGTPACWEMYTKKRLMYDYSGVVSPLIHIKGEVMTFENYARKNNEKALSF